MKRDYGRSLTLLCPTCASEDLNREGSLPEEQSSFLCGSCGLNFTYQEIREANGRRVSAAIEEIKKEVVDDFSSQVKNMFKGLKGWSIR